MEQTFYISENISRNGETKFGIFQNKRYERILDSSEQFSNPSKYILLYDLKPNSKYKLNIKNFDSIISIVGRNVDLINKIEKKYDIELPILRNILSHLLTIQGGGIELIKTSEKHLIDQFITQELCLLGIDVRKYTQDEIDKINMENKIKTEKNIESMFDKINKSLDDIQNQEDELKFKPYHYQNEVLNNLKEFMEIKTGKLLWACGLGKTYMSLFICHHINSKNILICVPSKNLLDQFNQSVKNLFGIIPFKNYSEGNNIKDIIESLQNNKLNVVISTYQSVSKLINYLNEDFFFDIKIADECHHLVSIKSNYLNSLNNDSNHFNKFFDIPSKYTLFMTATEKNYDSKSKEVFTMNDREQFGCTIDKKSIKWAIENKKITDYNIVCIHNKLSLINSIIENLNLKLLIEQYNKNKLQSNNINKEDFKINDKELFMAAFCALKMIKESKSKHMLIYTNKCYSSDIIEMIIKQLIDKKIFTINGLYNKSLTSKTFKYNDIMDFTEEIESFKNSTFGIISCVYIFGEGFDLPTLDSVVIAEKMSTEIRIVQSCMRPNRLDSNNPNKVGQIIIPLNSSQIDEKVKMVIKNMSIDDDMIEQKIKFFKLAMNKKTDKNEYYYENKVKFKSNKILLNQLILDIYKSGSFGKELTLEKEYQLYQDIVLRKKFLTVKEYLDSDMEHKKPPVYFMGVWKDWYEFLGIDTSEWIDNKIEWSKYCKEKNINNAKQYIDFINENKDNNIPPEPEYFYPNFKGITNELVTKKYRYIKK